MVLEYLAERFREEVDYPEAEVNEILKAFNDDFASMRRYLVDEGLLTRSNGYYSRPSESAGSIHPVSGATSHSSGSSAITATCSRAAG